MRLFITSTNGAKVELCDQSGLSVCHYVCVHCKQ